MVSQIITWLDRFHPQPISWTRKKMNSIVYVQRILQNMRIFVFSISIAMTSHERHIVPITGNLTV